MSSSRKRNFRQRSSSGDLNSDDKPAPPPAPPPKNKNPRSDGGSRLSFAVDEEEDEADSGRPCIRPSSSAGLRAAPPRSAPLHKLTPARERASANPNPKLSNVQPQAGEYTKEKLLELQKNARPLGAAPRPPNKPEPPSGAVVVLKGLIKPVFSPPKKTEGEKEGGNGEEAASVGRGKPPSKESLMFPDQVTIDAIKVKRERLRQSQGPAPDYISLDAGSVLGSRSRSSAGTGGSSDEEDGNEFHSRIALFGEKDAGDSMKRGVFEEVNERRAVVEPCIVGDDEDDEDPKWEEEQLRKGLGKRIDEASTHLGVSNVPPSSIVSVPVHHSQPSVMASIGVSRSAEVLSIPQMGEVAIRTLYENISRQREMYNQSMTSLARVEENISESLSEITHMEKSLEDLGEEFVFMQQLRDFISVLCDFLQDKDPFIEELEEQMQKLHEERASVVVERRASDLTDECSEVEAGVNAAMAALKKGSSQASVSVAAAAAQAAAASVRESSNLAVQLDELGRDLNRQKHLDRARRAEARKRRKDRSEWKRLSALARDNVLHRIEGESSTDESDTDINAFKSTRDELLQTAAEIFSNADDEYSKLSIVKEKFVKWRQAYPTSYGDAYMSLSAPDIFSSFVRLEFLKWDPLYERIEFNDMEWHSLLFEYEFPAQGNGFNTEDPDANLIPELVEKVALPILHHEIAHCWDILSTERTANAVFATKLVIDYIPASSKGLQELLCLIHNRLVEVVASLVVPAWKMVLTNIVSGAAQLAANRFGMAIRLLKNVCLWVDVLALPVLEKLALEELLGKKILPHIEAIMPNNIHDSITRTERVVASLSGIWYGSSVTTDHRSKLQPLVECIARQGKILEERRKYASEEETLGLARRLKKLLVELNEYDRARDVLRRFQLKEAL